MRKVVLHYHLFKNAGTSLDGLLERNFGAAWTTFEGAHAAARLDSPEVARFIDDTPGLKAVSSHHARLPLPVISNGRVIPLVMLRHPIDRVGSVYTFERKQGSGSRGADFAGAHTFAEYVRWRLDLMRHGVINNFQAMFFLNTFGTDRRPIVPAEIPEALARIEAFDFVGIVERYTESVNLLGHVLRRDFPSFQIAHERRNHSKERASSLEQRLDDIRASLGDSLWNELCERNHIDLELYQGAVAMFERRLAELPEAARRAS